MIRLKIVGGWLERGEEEIAYSDCLVGHLRIGKSASPMAEEKHQNKAKKTMELIEFAKSNNLILEDVPEVTFHQNPKVSHQ